jgi:hypothetical protein
MCSLSPCPELRESNFLRFFCNSYSELKSSVLIHLCGVGTLQRPNGLGSFEGRGCGDATREFGGKAANGQAETGPHQEGSAECGYRGDGLRGPLGALRQLQQQSPYPLVDALHPHRRSRGWGWIMPRPSGGVSCDRRP